jgi:hypothetical protein
VAHCNEQYTRIPPEHLQNISEREKEAIGGYNSRTEKNPFQDSVV